MQSRIKDLYPISKDYQRFDVRNVAFNRANAHKRATEDSTKLVESPNITRMKKQQPGFSLLDYTFRDAAFTVAHATQSGFGYMNSGLYSWAPLGSAIKPAEIPRWEGTSTEAAQILTQAAQYYGALEVGFCETDERWLYSHDKQGRPIIMQDVEHWSITEDQVIIPRRYRHAIVMIVPMEAREMSFAPAAVNATSNMGYSRMAALAGSVAEFIRGLGWNAIPCGNDTAISVPMAIQAGLGHAGRNGRLITPKYGGLVRICKIFTDLPLIQSPLASTEVLRFCGTCQKCGQACPAHAISMDSPTSEGYSPANNPGVRKWYVNADDCLTFWNKIGTSCAICYRVCPFSQPRTRSHAIFRWSIRHLPVLNRIWMWIHRIRGHEKVKDPNTYW